MKNNKIYIGDNLSIMNSSEFKQHAGKIKFIYIDPPYNTLTDKSYSDTNNTQAWQNFIKQRLQKSKKLYLLKIAY